MGGCWQNHAQYIIQQRRNSWQATATGTSKFDSGFGIGIAYGKTPEGSCLWVAVGEGMDPILYSNNEHLAASTDTADLNAGIGVAFDHLLYGRQRLLSSPIKKHK